MINHEIFNVKMADGTWHENVEPILADKMKYSDTARRRKWGQMSEDVARYMAFICWRALVRTGAIGDMGWDEFIDNAVSVSPVYDENGEPLVEAVEPFPG